METDDTTAVIEPEEPADSDALEYAETGEPESALSKIQNSKVLIYLTLLSRLVLGGIFLLAGLSKLGDVKGMLDSITDYEMVLPSWLPELMARGLPPLEIAIGIFLLLGLFTRIAAALAGGLMIVFLFALIQAMVRGFGNQISCGCIATGPGANPIGTAILSALGPIGTFLASEKAGPESIIRDILFFLMAIHLMFVPTIFSLDNWRKKSA